MIDTYKEVRECDYKGEHYSVRDNGAIMRHPRPGKKPRPKDGVWTFGEKNEKNGYMYFTGTVRVHAVVATAFYGEHDSTKLVVDHIDTNRCNNRAENLHWVTRLENALMNPITRKRIEWLCGGDIQKFIDDPSCLRTDNPKAQDVSWMRTVTPEEARNAYVNAMRWAMKKPSPIPSPQHVEGERDKEWMFKPPKPEGIREFDDLGSMPYVHVQEDFGPQGVKAASPETALQRAWSTPSTFPNCPNEKATQEGLAKYAAALVRGAVFSENQYGRSVVAESELAKGGTELIVRASSPSEIKPGGTLARITVEGDFFVHESLGTFFTEEGAQKEYTLALGREWTGGDTFDDLC